MRKSCVYDITRCENKIVGRGAIITFSSKNKNELEECLKQISKVIQNKENTIIEKEESSYKIYIEVNNKGQYELIKEEYKTIK